MATADNFPPHDAAAPFKFPEQEEQVLAHWRSIDAFKTSLRQSEGKPLFTFFDGPPFATGLPHYGHLLAGTIKDIVTRHAHSTGHHVERRFGWDCHGLPVEHEIDKKLGITGKEDVMKMGIDKYNAECRAIVMRYQAEWKTTVERMGRWIDFDGGYKTLDKTFMESVWWVFGQLYQKGLVYRGLKVMPYSMGCTTPLSNFEAGLDYRDVQDPAVTISFPLVDDPTTALLAWTTTPWTLPSNLGLCVHPDFEYIKIYDEERKMNFWILEKLLTTLYKDPKKAKFSKVAKAKGSEMVGWKFEPVFPYFYEKYKETAFRVVSDTYVTADAGTGIVQQAPAFGDDDYRIAIANGIVTREVPPPCPLDESGRFTAEVPDYKGINVKEADKQIQKDLKASGRMIVQSTLRHSYPYCWRSKSPLIYRAIPAWFVRVEEIQDRLQTHNAGTHWVPTWVKESRFDHWLANARDWNVSRNRYWGTPIPLWASDDMEEIVCVKSVEELEKLSGRSDIQDLHRESIDGITIPSQKGKGVLKRVEEVFDCWFESGSMPYAQGHYPFENKDTFETGFPGDFICEGLDQTRGWFYTLLILGTHLFDKSPWKNLIVTGLVLAGDGKKMSKSARNYPDPTLMFDKYGADAVRLYLVNSPVVRGENLKFREEGVKDVLAMAFLPWLNSFRFFLGQVALLKKLTGKDFRYDVNAPKSENVFDRWILARCQSLIQWVRDEMDGYRLYTVMPRLLNLIDELTNWYIRFNRQRLKGVNGVDDTYAALNSLFETLYTLCRTMSSFTPFLTETIYQGLRPFLPAAPASDKQDYRSVHFLPFPEVNSLYLDPIIQRRFAALQTVIELTRTVRERNTIPLRSPLQELVVFHADADFLKDAESLSSYISEELNVRDLTFTSDETACGVRYKLVADWPVLGRKLRKDMGKVKKGLEEVTSDQAKEYLEKKKLNVAGVDLVEGDLKVLRYVDLEGRSGKWDHNGDGEAVVLLDIEARPALVSEFNARELVNRIQRLRKKAGLQPTDEIDAFYSFTEGVGAALKEAFEEQKEMFQKVIRRVPMGVEQRAPNAELITEEEQEIGDDKFTLSLVRA
ncbi:putative ILS1-isoleucyl-tRNA synthetase [Ceraceosorus guamensis]|uniref:Isoleucine--tRNA ligase, cytoplasmic n=1 Tax=Ceraceosorus guamensis TaxID=1522189 RepID=A0A316W3M3_9BASI|nr:putative ILS1-isoleucyl-tRNA synthetase [Ceraceosorus guamensis]PWN42175.1 putative ILS1-isoleucyl-tRNA synthetase [Ceraceosorus guamensis]